MRRLLWLGLTALLTTTTAVTGCGSDDDTTSPSGSGGATSGSGGATSGSGGATTTGSGGSGGGSTTTTTFGDDRPVELLVPDGYDAATPAPLMILLHGYSATGAIQNLYFGLDSVANDNGMLYAFPDGTIDAQDNQFWNATDACCNFGGSSVDDSAYLRKLVEDISAAYNVDPKRIYFVGHSNGGFMSYRMACDHADKVAAIVSLAGATYKDSSNCNPTEPVNVLQIHGTMDETIAYDGGSNIGNAYPSAQETVDYWAGVAACDLQSPTDGGMLDIDASLAGDETTVLRYETGCMPGGSAELWTIEGGPHVPMPLVSDYAEKLVAYLLAHPKP